MEPRDRLANLALLVAAGVAWIAVAIVLTTRDPLTDPAAGPIGAVAIGVAAGLTAAPLFWLLGFGRQRRIAYHGDWVRALRRAAWIGILVAVFVLLRVLDVFQLPIALFLVALVLVAEVTLSTRR